jgi:hypothetical protein
MREAVASTPPRLMAGCAGCPARCQYPAYVSPIREALDKQIKPKLITPMSAAERQTAVEQSVAQLEAAMPMLKLRKSNPNIRRHWLYCALTHVALPPDLPPVVEANRKAVLDRLRVNVVDAELAELSDIVGGAG